MTPVAQKAPALNRHASIQSLPPHILFKIIRYLHNSPLKARSADLANLLEFALTCRQFGLAITSYLWKDLYIGFYIWMAYPERTCLYQIVVPRLVHQSSERTTPEEYFNAQPFSTPITENAEFFPMEKNSVTAKFAQRSKDSTFGPALEKYNQQMIKFQLYLYRISNIQLTCNTSKEVMRLFPMNGLNSAVVDIQDQGHTLSEITPIQFKTTRSQKKIALLKLIHKYKQLENVWHLKINIYDSFQVPADFEYYRHLIHNLNLVRGRNFSSLELKFPLGTSSNLNLFWGVYDTLVSLDLDIRGNHCIFSFCDTLRKFVNMSMLLIKTTGLELCSHSTHNFEDSCTILNETFREKLQKVTVFQFSSRDIKISDIPSNTQKLVLKGDHSDFYNSKQSLFEEVSYSKVEYMSLTEYGALNGLGEDESNTHPSTRTQKDYPIEMLKGLQFPLQHLKQLELNNFILKDPPYVKYLQAVFVHNQQIESFSCLYMDWSVLKHLAKFGQRLKVLAIMRSMPVDLALEEPVTEQEYDQVFSQSIKTQVKGELWKSISSVHGLADQPNGDMFGDIAGRKADSISPLIPVNLDLEETRPDPDDLLVLSKFPSLSLLLISVRSDVNAFSQIKQIISNRKSSMATRIKVDQVLPISGIRMSDDSNYFNTLVDTLKGSYNLVCTPETMYGLSGKQQTAPLNSNALPVTDFSSLFYDKEVDGEMVALESKVQDLAEKSGFAYQQNPTASSKETGVPNSKETQAVAQPNSVQLTGERGNDAAATKARKIGNQKEKEAQARGAATNQQHVYISDSITLKNTLFLDNRQTDYSSWYRLDGPQLENKMQAELSKKYKDQTSHSKSRANATATTSPNADSSYNFMLQFVPTNYSESLTHTKVSQHYLTTSKSQSFPFELYNAIIKPVK